MRTVTLVGAVVNILLAIIKVVGGAIAQSHALIADGVHSLSDLASDFVVVYGAKHGSRDADELHPYGHARIETAFTVIVGTMLIFVALGLITDAVRRLLDPSLLLHPEPLALAVAILSIVSKEWLYRYTIRVAMRVRSSMLQANAWHHRSDAISSVIVVVGVAGSMAGFDYLDPIASIGVAFMIAKIGWDLAWAASRELVDTGLDPARVDEIRESILHVEGVKDLHMLRTRLMGGDALVDVHVQVNRRLSVSEGHQIGEYVRATLIKSIDEVADVTVHIDPEDDAEGALSKQLPLRREFLARLHEHVRPILDPSSIRSVTLHYLGGRIQVEVVLSITVIHDLDEAAVLARTIRETTQQLRDVGDVQVYYG